MARDGRLDGWLVVDKPAGTTSAQAVARVKRLVRGVKVGHAGTLDPLATGVLPIALGEATKTVAYAMAGEKCYRFEVRWGEARDTDDAEGQVTATSEVRPDVAAITDALRTFRGELDQVPPPYSAIKIRGRRAYDLARAGAPVALEPRRVVVHRFDLLHADADGATFEVVCGAGTYVRALARDLARALGTVGHVAWLRRTRVGPYTDKDAIPLDKLDVLGHSLALAEHVLPVESALVDIPALTLTDHEADRLRSGQALPAPGVDPGTVYTKAGARLVALVEVDAGLLRPVRVFNL